LLAILHLCRFCETRALARVYDLTMMDLTTVEARVLGALVEKSRTTPDYYPMTLNALTAACNQSSNRDPVTAFTEVEIDDAMRSLRDRNAARSVRTSRSRIMKHQHDLENLLVIERAASSLLAVLLLRGPQTVGELRMRTERYHDFESLDAVEVSLRVMAADDPALVRRLDRQPGQKETRWVELLTAKAPEAVPEIRPTSATAFAQLPDLATRVEALEARVTELEQQLGD